MAPDSMAGSGPLLQMGPILVFLVLLAAMVAYGIGVARLRARGDRWPWSRSAAAAIGFGCLVAVLVLDPVLDLVPVLFPVPPVDAMALPVHAVRHLLLAMAAPLALAISAPITLALRTCPGRPRRILLTVLHSRLARALTTAPVVLVLDVGAMYGLYLTPLYSATHRHPSLSALVHLHFFLAGCLFSWYLVAVDPMPGRASTRTRMLVLFLAAGSHDLLAKLMYAHLLPQHGGSPGQIRLGAQIMFYGGDVIEIALAVAVLSGWYARTGRQLSRARRRQSETGTGTGTGTGPGTGTGTGTETGTETETGPGTAEVSDETPGTGTSARSTSRPG